MLIRHDIEQALWALIAAQCKKSGAVAPRLGGKPDHIHLLVMYSPNRALSKLDNPHQAELEPLNLPAPSRLQPASYA
jgi:REP element-mobilizing transposase RayT